MSEGPLKIVKDQVVSDAERRAEDLTAPLVEQGMAIIERLLQEIEVVQLPSRFRRNVSVEDLKRYVFPVETLTRIAAGRIEQEGEAGYKREQLLTGLIGVQQDLVRLAGRLQVIMVDLEMSKSEDDQLP